MVTLKHWIKSAKSINMVFDNGVKSVLDTNPLYGKISEIIDSHKTDGLWEMVNIAHRIAVKYDGLFGVDENTGIVYYKGDALPNALSNRLVQFANDNLDASPLLAFWNNVKLNPSIESVKDLYAFLEHNNIPITADGCFIAYKKVNENFFDHHSLKNDNHPGNVVKMDRSAVDPDRNHTCSSGLHVAAFNYAWGFGSGHMLEIKVNPKDVVAVPPDYNQEKMRVCEYTVVREIEDPNPEIVYQHDDSYQNNVDDSDEDQEDSEDNTEENFEDMVLYPGTNGRLRLPAKLVRDVLELNPGDIGYVSFNDDNTEIFVDVWKNPEVDEKVEYIVDCHNNLRIGRGLTGGYSVTVGTDSNTGNKYIQLKQEANEQE